MPIYEYVCQECQKPFEKLVLGQSEKIACPSCGSRRHKLQLSVIAAPAKSGSAAGSGCACTPSTCGCH